ncbi:hypothetical protein Tco_0272013, partial [Tanacetum coccineum]
YIKVSESAQDKDVGLGGSRFRNFAKKESMKKAFQDMLHGLGEVNPTHAYYNGSRTRDIFKIVSTVVYSGTFGESSMAGTAGIMTVEGVYGPLRMHFLRALPFGRSLDLAAMTLLCI